MKQYRKLFFLGFICAAWPVSYAQAQDVSAGVPDSLLTIGYTVGHTRNISSLVESFTGKQLKADQITNPLAWMEVKDKESVSRISTHAKLLLNFTPDLKMRLFGSYSYNMVENSQYLPTVVWAHGQAYRGVRKSESLVGNAMLTYRKRLKRHFIDALALAEVQEEKFSGFYTTCLLYTS